MWLHLLEIFVIWRRGLRFGQVMCHQFRDQRFRENPSHLQYPGGARVCSGLDNGKRCVRAIVITPTGVNGTCRSSCIWVKTRARKCVCLRRFLDPVPTI